MNIDRRHFLTTLGSTAAASALPLSAAEQPKPPAFLKGLSLTTYSLRQHMKWWKGENTKGRLSVADFLDHCAAWELEAAEVTSYFMARPVERKAVHEIRRHAHQLGLDISGGAMGNDFSHAPHSDKGKVNLAYAKEWIDHFSDMGAPVVRIFASRGRPKHADEATVISNVCANIEIALAHAEKRGVILGLENHDFLTNIDRLLQVIEKLSSKWLGVTWDSANLDRYPDPYKELARIAPHAVNAQIKVSTKVDGKEVPADYSRLIAILKEAKFRGYVVLEYEEEHDPFQAIPEELKKLRALL